jgi:hypothetical protein
VQQRIALAYKDVVVSTTQAAHRWNCSTAMLALYPGIVHPAFVQHSFAVAVEFIYRKLRQLDRALFAVLW